MASNSLELDVRNATDENDTPPLEAAEAIPDGDYGWTVIFACFIETFWVNGWSGAWGVLQTALLQSTLHQTAPSTLSFVGSLGLGLCVGLGLFCVRISQRIGARWSMLLGILLFGIGNVVSGSTVDNVDGLFVAAGISYGIGSSLMYTMSNNLPIQWFSRRLGTANGIVKLGGGLGATVMSVVLQLLIDKLGIAWAFRIMGSMALVSGVPAVLLIRERRMPSRNALAIDFSLFRSMPFCLLFLAGAIGTFALFVPPFFLPLLAKSIGLSATAGALILAAFNSCAAIGRLGSGVACGKLGPVNMLLLTMALNATSMLAIWPVSDTIAPLVVFSIVNGISNGAFFVTLPTAISRMLGPDQAAAGLGMAITGWTGGYLMGSPIAGFLIAATGAEDAQSIVPYRAAIFYAGGMALASSIFVMVARLGIDPKLYKKL